jgi:hypothetical protein
VSPIGGTASALELAAEVVVVAKLDRPGCDEVGLGDHDAGRAEPVLRARDRSLESVQRRGQGEDLARRLADADAALVDADDFPVELKAFPNLPSGATYVSPTTTVLPRSSSGFTSSPSTLAAGRRGHEERS